MLPAENRLKNKEDFALVMKTGQKTKVGPLMFFTLKNSEKVRIGFVVSKKVSRFAVVRNTIRRSLREIFRTLVPRISGMGDVVVVVLSNPREGREDLERAIAKWVQELS